MLQKNYSLPYIPDFGPTLYKYSVYVNDTMQKMIDATGGQKLNL